MYLGSLQHFRCKDHANHASLISGPTAPDPGDVIWRLPRSGTPLDDLAHEGAMVLSAQHKFLAIAISPRHYRNLSII